jgi:hypothetical protein
VSSRADAPVNGTASCIQQGAAADTQTSVVVGCQPASPLVRVCALLQQLVCPSLLDAQCSVLVPDTRCSNCSSCLMTPCSHPGLQARDMLPLLLPRRPTLLPRPCHHHRQSPRRQRQQQQQRQAALPAPSPPPQPPRLRRPRPSSLTWPTRALGPPRLPAPTSPTALAASRTFSTACGPQMAAVPSRTPMATQSTTPVGAEAGGRPAPLLTTQPSALSLPHIRPAGAPCTALWPPSIAAIMPAGAMCWLPLLPRTHPAGYERIVWDSTPACPHQPGAGTSVAIDTAGRLWGWDEASQANCAFKDAQGDRWARQRRGEDRQSLHAWQASQGRRAPGSSRRGDLQLSRQWEGPPVPPVC